MPKPPLIVRKRAKQGLEFRRKLGRGGLSKKQASKEGVGSGVQRAINLSNGDNISEKTLKRMVGFFSRHNKNFVKYRNGKITNGWISMLLWGGREGFSWAKSELKKIEKSKNKKK